MSIKKIKKEVESFLEEYHELREKYGKLSWDEWIEPNGQSNCFPISYLPLWEYNLLALTLRGACLFPPRGSFGRIERHSSLVGFCFSQSFKFLPCFITSGVTLLSRKMVDYPASLLQGLTRCPASVGMTVRDVSEYSLSAYSAEFNHSFRRNPPAVEEWGCSCATYLQIPVFHLNLFWQMLTFHGRPQLPTNQTWNRIRNSFLTSQEKAIIIAM